MKHALSYLFVSLALIGAGFLIGYKSHGNGPNPPIKERTDTLIVRDTITLEKPAYITKRITDTILIAVTDTLRIRDTLYLPLQREERVYRDSLYMAVVSGYRPSLDRLDIYRTERIVTLHAEPRKWGFGIAAGPGLLISPDGRAHFGIGVTAGVRWDF